MPRFKITDEIADGLEFARACVADRRTDSHAKRIRTYDARYDAAFSAIDAVLAAYRDAKAKAKEATKARVVDIEFGASYSPSAASAAWPACTGGPRPIFYTSGRLTSESARDAGGVEALKRRKSNPKKGRR